MVKGLNFMIPTFSSAGQNYKLTRAVLALSLTALFAAAPLRAEPKAGLPAFAVSNGAPLLSQAAATGAVVGQGGNYAVRLEDGRLIWFLNNVMAGELKPDGQGEVWSILDGAAAFSAAVSTGAPAPFLEYLAEENGLPLPLLAGGPGESQARRFWPRSGFCSGGKCWVFYSIMNNYGSDPYDYFRVGQGVAVSEKPEGTYRKVRVGGRNSFWNDIEPAFGSALLQDEDGWVYVYGRAITAPGEYGAALARVKPPQLDAPEKYSYYSVDAASGSWTGDVGEASVVLDAMPEDFSVSYNEFLKSYLAVYMDAEAGIVYARQARYPWGPWGPAEKLLACAQEDYCYGAKEQPALALAGGKKIALTVEKKNAPYLYELAFE